MTKAIVKQDFELRAQDFYTALVDDCRAIIVEREFNSRMEIIQGKWELGKRIVRDESYKKFGKGNRQIIAQLAKDIECSEPNIYFCIQFYEKFPESKELEKLGEGKNLSWHRIVMKYLGKRDLKKGMPRVTYKLEEILQAFRVFIVNYIDKEEIDIEVKAFKEHLIKLRK